MAKNVILYSHPDHTKVGDEGMQTSHASDGPKVQKAMIVRIYEDPESPSGFACDTHETSQATSVGYSAAYAANWDSIFGPKTEKEPDPVPDTKRSQLN